MAAVSPNLCCMCDCEPTPTVAEGVLMLCAGSWNLDIHEQHDGPLVLEQEHRQRGCGWRLSVHHQADDMCQQGLLCPGGTPIYWQCHSYCRLDDNSALPTPGHCPAGQMQMLCYHSQQCDGCQVLNGHLSQLAIPQFLMLIASFATVLSAVTCTTTGQGTATASVLPACCASCATASR